MQCQYRPDRKEGKHPCAGHVMCRVQRVASEAMTLLINKLEQQSDGNRPPSLWLSQRVAQLEVVRGGEVLRQTP